MRIVTNRKFTRPFLFYQDTFFIEQINLDSDRWIELLGIYQGYNPLNSPTKNLLYCSKNFDCISDREESLKLFDFWISNVQFAKLL